MCLEGRGQEELSTSLSLLNVARATDTEPRAQDRAGEQADAQGRAGSSSCLALMTRCCDSKAAGLGPHPGDQGGHTDAHLAGSLHHQLLCQATGRQKTWMEGETMPRAHQELATLAGVRVHSMGGASTRWPQTSSSFL